MKCLPIEGMTEAKITSEYGIRIHPISKVQSKHNGIDIGYPAGTKVHSVDDGKVVVSKMQGNGKGLGNYIVIKHSNYYSLYAHLAARMCQAGEKVSAGKVIGFVGSTGDSTGPHLHFACCTLYVSDNVNKSAFYDPEKELRELIEEASEVVKKINILADGEKTTVSVINKNNENYIRLRDLELLDSRIKVSYNKIQRLPEVKTK